METELKSKVNGHNALMTMSAEDMKRAYMERVYAMNHDQMFQELLRVHTESARLLMEAHKELERFRALFDSDGSFV
jgi:hypothetical protein